MQVSIERYVEQVQDGLSYLGYVQIADTKFEYELRFSVPIPVLDDMEPVDKIREVRQIFQLTVKKNGVVLDLSDPEYMLFFGMLINFIVDFYYLESTRSLNGDNKLGQLLRRNGPLAAPGARVSIGIRNKGSYEFTPSICEMLNSQKFGCSLNN